MFRTFAIPLSWSELAGRTLKETSADSALGLSAQLAFYFLLSLVPAIVCVLALASFLPGRLIQDVPAALASVAPAEVVQIIRDQLSNIGGRNNGGLLTFGLLMALWSSSAAMVSITDALNRAYDIEEARPWWQVRLTAIALTVGVAVFVVVAFGLVLVGPTLAEQLSLRFGFGRVFELMWKVLQWPIVFVLMTTGIGLVYYFAPDAEQDWEWVTPGAVLATILWLLASLAFKLYVTAFGNYEEAYGPLGGIVVLMLWFYISGLAILVGAEMNAEIEHASPHGKAPGEKVPGRKKKLGAAAARAYEERQRTASLRPAAAAVDAGETTPRRSVAAYIGLAVGLVAAFARKSRKR